MQKRIALPTEKEEGRTDIAFSSDNGFTWTKPQQVLEASEHAADLTLFKD